MFLCSLKNSFVDIFGIMYLDFYHKRHQNYYTIRRDDGFVDTNNKVEVYFQDYVNWADIDKIMLISAKGRILDIGAGAGRHSMYFQKKGNDVYAFDSSPLAIKVMRLRGIKNVFLGNINKIEEMGFKNYFFDTVLMMFNNFGLAGSVSGTRQLLKKLYRITSKDGKIISVGINPYITDNENHINYNRNLLERGRPSSIKLQIIYKNIIGPWYKLLMVSPEEMKSLIKRTGWKIYQVENFNSATYGVVLIKE